MKVTKLRRLVPLFVLVALVVVLVVTIAPASAARGGTVKVQILAVNDFHGNLQPPAGSSGRVTTATGTVDAGGVEYLATHVAELRAENRRTVFVSAGDMIGATPLLSALFHDEPSVEAFNRMKLDFNAVGNHEFDEGIQELLRMQRGGCHPIDGCLDGDGFTGARFRYLAANVINDQTGRPLFPAFRIRNFAGVKIAFIGMTLEGTPNIVTPSGIQGYSFQDEADTVNALIPRLRRQGVQAIVVLIHEGGYPTGLYNECPGISGPIVDIVERTHSQVDLFITGHTHQAYNCVIDGRPVTSAMSFGRIVTDIDMELSRATGRVESISINNEIVTRDVTPDSWMTALIAKYNAVAAPLANRIIGQITADILRAANPAGESALGDVIADAQLDATDDPGFGDAVAAFMNPGGIRADLTYAGSVAGEGDGNVTYGESFTVQPFGNSLVTMTLTGEQIDTMLEQQWLGPNAAAAKILQVSDGFTYSWSASAPAGSKVDIASIMINGVPINPTATYRVTVNSFLADGGDGFAVLVQGTDRLGGAVDTDALEAYFVTHSPVPPGPQNRITVLP
ncbi:MAG: bifunctional metallophosphatase/5'-nucleotidase [Anaerolineae bacterium]|uniref:bifunctional metallophosphatase/5'-nucleotidase n=1 Tax=Promineifilum sp. TaxID=2664178 RepID=UPI001D1EA028|nr:bifunctional metallophosphatase/5'-nucleotidase [Anaerolineales bacterium]MCB8933971.1 bifunctional metallophosphatase/5'-nucleotidase [Promineifilum sp.]MCO5179371.1 bifunctional metallophosphatase/5'-nucleotidase [Promineifilum sp.]MCW5845914.1 bifunctional metallophosphatase/5'-nucleotidase [Anaerolineae bacterium]